VTSVDPFGDAWEMLQTPAPTSVTVRGVEVKAGQRVRLRPGTGGDVMDLALAGRTAVVETIDVTMDDEPRFAVTIDDDPGREFGNHKYPGHRFFFRAEEIDVIEEPASEPRMTRVRVLVAGIGNIFFGDDGFGVAVAARLANGAQSPDVTVRDFGIRGLDLAYALQDDYDVAILVDAMPKGGEPGTLYVLEPELTNDSPLDGAVFDAHAMDPVRVLRLARSLGRVPPRVVVVGCEPATVETSGELGDALVSLSPAVERAVGEAAYVVDVLVRELIIQQSSSRGSPCPSEPGPGSSSAS
jgi:hydrogenase maturation protease